MYKNGGKSRHRNEKEREVDEKRKRKDRTRETKMVNKSKKIYVKWEGKEQDNRRSTKKCTTKIAKEWNGNVTM